MISDSLAFNVFSSDDAFNVREDGRHVSTALFEQPRHLRKAALRLLQTYIRQSGCKSVIGFAENDPSLTAFAAQASSEENLPFYSYGLEHRGEAFFQLVRPEAAPCCLVIPYSVSQQQVMKAIGVFLQRQVPISCVVSFVDENPSKTALSDQGIEFVSTCDWISLRDRMSRYQGLTGERMDQLMAIFS